jgi:hypothetical protein
VIRVSYRDPPVLERAPQSVSEASSTLAKEKGFTHAADLVNLNRDVRGAIGQLNTRVLPLRRARSQTILRQIV